jgi:hypothetical protein
MGLSVPAYLLMERENRGRYRHRAFSKNGSSFSLSPNQNDGSLNEEQIERLGLTLRSWKRE